MTNSEDKDLTSWKEIADYLGVTPRTAQKWEKERGLPIRRVPGEKRSVVYATVSELREWKNERGLFPNPPSDPEADPKTAARAGRKLTVSLVLLIVIAVIGGTLIVLRQQVDTPAEWKVVNDSLIISDDTGRELWRKTFEDGLRPEYARLSAETNVVVTLFHDLDGDGTTETLFVQQRPVGTPKSDVLWCFSGDGSVKWRFEPGRVLKTGVGSLDEIYRTRNFRVTSFKENQPPSIVVASFHHLEFTTQVVVLSSNGSLSKEYWHAGHVGTGPRQMEIADLNGDGVSEIYLAGVNNARDVATLVVVDPDKMQGASEEHDAEHHLLDVPAARGVKRVFFPQTCTGLLTHEYNVAVDLYLLKNGITVSVNETVTQSQSATVLYTLRPDFSVERVVFSDVFESMHDRFERAKQVDHPLARHRENLPAIQVLMD